MEKKCSFSNTCMNVFCVFFLAIQKILEIKSYFHSSSGQQSSMLDDINTKKNHHGLCCASKSALFSAPCLLFGGYDEV